jgi:cyclophilin family peptidyl-prolyl cis-trans isomerase
MKTLLMLAAAAVATPAPKPALAPSEIVAAAPKGDWVAISPSDLLVMDLDSGKRVVIQLMPPPFSQGWVGNIRKLAAARWWDGTSVNRVQDNYVVQWGDANAEDKANAKVLPSGLAKVPQSEYAQQVEIRQMYDELVHGYYAYPSMTFYPRPKGSADLGPLLSGAKPYAPMEGFSHGWPVGATGPLFLRLGGKEKDFIWPVHCYGMVGVGRDMPPDTGTGAELYTVIGHAPRHLDRNIALVGRVISGIEHLSSLPRGMGPLGFYEKPEERTTITSIRIGTDVKDLARFEYLSTESASFATYADARANRRDPFFIRPAGGADICNIPVPVRVVK